MVELPMATMKTQALKQFQKCFRKGPFKGGENSRWGAARDQATSFNATSSAEASRRVFTVLRARQTFFLGCISCGGHEELEERLTVEAVLNRY